MQGTHGPSASLISPDADQEMEDGRWKMEDMMKSSKKPQQNRQKSQQIRTTSC